MTNWLIDSGNWSQPVSQQRTVASGGPIELELEESVPSLGYVCVPDHVSEDFFALLVVRIQHADFEDGRYWPMVRRLELRSSVAATENG